MMLDGVATVGMMIDEMATVRMIYGISDDGIVIDGVIIGRIMIEWL